MLQPPINFFKTNQSDWNDHKGGYDPSKTLDDEQVKQMTTNLLATNNLGDQCYSQVLDISPSVINSIGNNYIKDQLQSALESARGKPIILQVCNGSHWITMGLLPNPKNPEEYYVVKMDGKAKEVAFDEVQAQKTYDNDQEKINEAKKEYEDDQKKHQLDPKPVITALKANTLGLTFLTAADGKAFDLSVKGQQYDNSCGLDTALNSVSIMKTYIDLKKNNSFNTIFNCNNFEKDFKKANDKTLKEK
jgi:hypothetical protein